MDIKNLLKEFEESDSFENLSLLDEEFNSVLSLFFYSNLLVKLPLALDILKIKNSKGTLQGQIIKK